MPSAAHPSAADQVPIVMLWTGSVATWVALLGSVHSLGTGMLPGVAGVSVPTVPAKGQRSDDRVAGWRVAVLNGERRRESGFVPIGQEECLACQ